MKIKLKQVIEAMEAASESTCAYYDIETGETIWVSDDLYSGGIDTDLAEMIEYAAPGRFLPFPTKHEIHEYSMIDAFVDSLPAGTVRQDIESAIRGRGAFRRFKQSLRYHRLEQRWYDYRAQAYRDIALRWCRDNELEVDGAASAEQLQRVTHMERLLNEAAAAVSVMDNAIEGYRAVQENIAELRHYYEGGQWMEDVQADADGKLPPTLPRGVLTEDAIYDLLTDQVRLREVFRELGCRRENEN